MNSIRTGLILASISSLALAVACGGSEESTSTTAAETTDPIASTSSSSSSGSSSSSSSSGAASSGDAPFVCEDEGGEGWGHIPIPDSGVVEGPLACGACSQAKCTADVDKCGASCECRTIVNDVVACVASGGDPIGCATPAFSASEDVKGIAFALFQCSQEKCADSCAQR